MNNLAFKDTNFLYLSTGIRSMENRLFSKSDLYKMIEMKNFDEAYRFMLDWFSVSSENCENSDKILSKILKATYDEVENMLNISSFEKKLSILSPLRYIYDCHNLKSAIKCEALNVSPNEIYIDCGTVPREKITELVRERNFKDFSENLAEFSPVAIETLSSSKDPQCVDFILDKAAFTDMNEACNLLNIDYLKNLIECKCDIANILTFFRCIKQKRVLGFMQSVLLPFGKISISFYEECFDGTYDKLISGLAYSDYKLISESFTNKNIAMQNLERICEDIFMDSVRRAKYIPFGPEIAIAYIEAVEYEIKNLRIILAGKKSNMAPETLKERLRVNY